MREYPEPTPEPCNECPWRRVAARGWLGPYNPHDWIKIAHSEAPIACHKTIVVTDPLEQTGDWDHPKLRQCRGAGIFRANVGKLPRNPSITTGPREAEKVFDSNDEFIEHHEGETMTAEDFYGPLSTESGDSS